MKKLKILQALPLKEKILLSNKRIKDWHEYWCGETFVSFSGGKDSTVLLHLIRQLYPSTPAVFFDTGLEFPEIRQFCKETPNTEFVRPKHSFKYIIEKYGYPVVSKEQAKSIREFRESNSIYLKNRSLLGKTSKSGIKSGKIFNKWRYLINAPFKISEKCCYFLKKSLSTAYTKKHNKVPYIGVMAQESRLRTSSYAKHQCNMYRSSKPQSRPIMFWTETDIWNYINKFNLTYSSIYDKGYERTGCTFCMFGLSKESYPNRFQLMYDTHPELWNYCINKLNIKAILDYMDIPYKPKKFSNTIDSLFE